MPTKDIHCSFCSQSRHQVRKMVEGPVIKGVQIYICDECIDASHSAIHGRSSVKREKKISIFTPSEIHAHLDDYVVGQDEAKRTLAVAIYNHYKRINDLIEGNTDTELQKSNVLIIGPSGTGKTLLASSVARIMNLPFAIGDATTLTESGYVGDDVEKLVERLLQSADGDVEAAERGIIFIDEIDKKSRKGTNSSTKDVSGEGVQQALLKLVEGTTVKVRYQHESYDIDTSNILFVIGGAFVGLSEIVKKSQQGKSSMGFGAEIKDAEKDSELFKLASPDDLTKYGLIPEFVGRFPVTVALDSLSEETMIRILKEPKNSIIQQYQRLFQIDGVTLTFADKYIESIAKQGFKQKTGARGLRAIIEKDLADIQFSLPDLAKQGFRHILVQDDGTIKQTKRKPRTQNKEKANG
jgi:ATP-dependent Clp protease ATP-binding subunit ClpX